jgi:hypothetical protein
VSGLLLAALLFQVQDLRTVQRDCPFTVVTLAGDRVGSLDPPNHDGKPVRFRLCGSKTLTLLPAADVDWAATDRANSGDAPTPTPVPVPTVPSRPSLRKLAKDITLRDPDEAVQRNQSLSGKMKVGGREVAFDRSAPFFGSDSVARYLQLSSFHADVSGCPAQRARAYGSVKNISKVKLRGLKALVVIGSLKSGDANGQVQTMDPSDLVPGEEAEILLWLSCDWAGKAAARSPYEGETVLVVLGDVAGRTEEVARPDGTNPFEKPEAKAASPPKTPTAAPLGGAPLRPR